MELSRGASAPDPDDVRPLKPCLLRRNHSRDQHGVAASSLEELRSKACELLAIDKSLTPITLVLAEDGTIVDDDDYFLCLPSNTKFVALACNEKWTYNDSDGGTAWVSQESFEADEPDSGAGVKWKNVARQLKEDLSSIILLSEEDLQINLLGLRGLNLAPPENRPPSEVPQELNSGPLQEHQRRQSTGLENPQPMFPIRRSDTATYMPDRPEGEIEVWDECSGFIVLSTQALIDIPCAELAQELCQSCATVQGLQSTLQQVLDQREEARQSKQLLELYLQALEKEGNILANQKESKAALSEELDAVDTGVGRETASEVLLRSQILTTLKEKPAPELSLSSQDLESVSKEDPKALAVALSWDIRKAETVQQACTTELALRLQQVQSLHSLRNLSARRSPLPGEPQRPKRAKQDSS